MKKARTFALPIEKRESKKEFFAIEKGEVPIDIGSLEIHNLIIFFYWNWFRLMKVISSLKVWKQQQLPILVSGSIR